MINSGRTAEDAVLGRTIEIALPLDGAIVLARCLLKLDTNPFTSLERGISKEANDTDPAVVQFDLLA